MLSKAFFTYIQSMDTRGHTLVRVFFFTSTHIIFCKNGLAQ